VIGDGRVDGTPEVCAARPQRGDEAMIAATTPLEAARRADAEAGAHQEPQVESADVDEEPKSPTMAPMESCVRCRARGDRSGCQGQIRDNREQLGLQE